MSDIEDQVRRLWARDEVREYARRQDALDPGDAPMISFVGFNVTPERILTAKVNHHHFLRLDDDVLDELVPNRAVFDRYYPKWEPKGEHTRHETGSAFVVKVAPDAPATYQFHFRFPFQDEDFEELGVAPHEIDLRDYTLNPGISFEYTGSETLKKLYYYLESPEHKRIIARQFSEPFAESAGMLEYTQTDKDRKVIMWNFQVGESEEYFRSLGWSTLDGLIDFMAQFGCVPMFPGVYEGKDVRAVYFFRFPEPGEDPWSNPANRQIRTLRHLPILDRS